jgi:thymidine kinase
MVHNNVGGGKGRLEVICGSMFSGKTEELIRRLKRADYAHQKVLALKHHLDKRRSISPANLTSHQGLERVAFMVGDNALGIEKVLEMATPDVTVVGIDEVQFFSPEIVNVICTLVEHGKRVVAAGLDLDFRGEPFGVMPVLMAIADEVTKLKAICTRCGREAHHTQRLVNGNPAKYDDPQILIGAAECYEARCRDCFIIDKPAKILAFTQAAVGWRQGTAE